MLFFIIIMMTSGCNSDNRLTPYTSDGCSRFPDGTLEQSNLWLHCCEEHDRAYWLGGTYQQRQKADEALKRCVAQTGESFIAELMMQGVKVGGSPYWPTKYRWGYGWPYPRGYKPLSDEELLQVKELAP